MPILQCETCSQPIEQPGRGRPRRFCLECRPRDRKPQGPKRESERCPCGEPLTGYAVKFCSRACAVRSRWLNLQSRAKCSSCGAATGYKASSAPESPLCRLCRSAAASLTGDPEHGNKRGYQILGCRCDACREWKRVSDRRYMDGYRARIGHGRARSGRVDAPTRLRVYARDKGVCRLCGQPVDLSLPYRHPLAATVDHIECQSWALIPDHSADNLRLAHRSCNSRRGNRA